YAGGNLEWAKLEDARAAVNRALSLKPDSPVALMALVYNHWMIADERRSLAIGKKVLDAHPEDLDAIAAAATAYFRAGMLDRATPLYRKALSADPSNIFFRAQLARSYLYAGEYRNGADLLTPELEAGDIGKWAMLLYKELGQFDKAVQVAELTTHNR